MNKYLQNNGILYNLDAVSKIAIIPDGNRYGIALYTDGPTSKVYELLQGTFSSSAEANDAFVEITARIDGPNAVIFYDDIHKKVTESYNH